MIPGYWWSYKGCKVDTVPPPSTDAIILTSVSNEKKHGRLGLGCVVPSFQLSAPSDSTQAAFLSTTNASCDPTRASEQENKTILRKRKIKAATTGDL